MTTVLIADDHNFLRAGVAVLLERAGLEVVASVGDGLQALDAIAATNPDVVLLDIRMPGLGGVETVGRLRRSGDRRPVIILATEMDDDELVLLVQSDVDAILFKSCADDDLVRTIGNVAAGQTSLDRSLLHRARDLADARPPALRPDSLSPREREIARLIGDGLRNDDIAERLGIKVGSVKVHVHSILAKTGAKSRGELHGILDA